MRIYARDGLARNFFIRGTSYHNEAGDHDIRPSIFCGPAKAATSISEETEQKRNGVLGILFQARAVAIDEEEIIDQREPGPAEEKGRPWSVDLRMAVEFVSE